MQKHNQQPEAVILIFFYFAVAILSLFVVGTSVQASQTHRPVSASELSEADSPQWLRDNKSRLRCNEIFVCVYSPRHLPPVQLIQKLRLERLRGRFLVPEVDGQLELSDNRTEIVFSYYKEGGPDKGPTESDKKVIQGIGEYLVTYDREREFGPTPDRVHISVEVIAMESNQARDFRLAINSFDIGLSPDGIGYGTKKSYDDGTFGLAFGSTQVALQLRNSNKRGRSKSVATYEMEVEDQQYISATELKEVHKDLQFSNQVIAKQVGITVSGRPHIVSSNGTIRLEYFQVALGLMEDPANSQNVIEIKPQPSSFNLLPGFTHVIYGSQMKFTSTSKETGFLSFGKGSEVVESQILILVTAERVSGDPTEHTENMRVDLNNQLSEASVSKLKSTVSPDLELSKSLAAIAVVKGTVLNDLYYGVLVDPGLEFATQGILDRRIEVSAQIDVKSDGRKEKWASWLSPRTRSLEEILATPILLSNEDLPKEVQKQILTSEKEFRVRINFCPLNGFQCVQEKQVTHQFYLNPNRYKLYRGE
jgi:hypothetical protein